MADKTPYNRFTDALDSLKDVVRNEIALINLAAKHRAKLNDLPDEELKARMDNLSVEEQQIFAAAEEEKEGFLESRRLDLKVVISGIANERREAWKKVKLARAKEFENVSEKLKASAAAAKEAEKLPSDAGLQSAAATRQSVCPPGFIEVDGICVPI